MHIVHYHEDFPLLPGLRVRAVIDPRAVTDNYRALLEPVLAVSPHTRAIAVVKSDAYGHGIRPVVGALLEEGCRFFAVACIEEAVALRRLLRELTGDSAEADAQTDILVLGFTDPRNVTTLASHRITATLLSEAYAQSLQACAREAKVTVRVHAALDTGMNRIGYPAHTPEEIERTVESLAALWKDCEACDGEGGLLPLGMFTHFARADEDYATEMEDGDSLTMTQFARYRAVLEGLAAKGVTPGFCHVCNSAASARFPLALPEGCMDGVRLGIGLYGYGIDPVNSDTGTTLAPAMKLETAVTHIHTLLPGETVGYGGTYTADTVRTLATLPVGYADGWLRAFAGTSVTFHTPEGDVTAPIVGRICMDQCMADVTGLPVEVGTRVTLFGGCRRELEALAERAHTIPYELLCLITARVPRVYS